MLIKKRRRPYMTVDERIEMHLGAMDDLANSLERSLRAFRKELALIPSFYLDTEEGQRDLDSRVSYLSEYEEAINETIGNLRLIAYGTRDQLLSVPSTDEDRSVIYRGLLRISGAWYKRGNSYLTVVREAATKHNYTRLIKTRALWLWWRGEC